MLRGCIKWHISKFKFGEAINFVLKLATIVVSFPHNPYALFGSLSSG